MTHDGRKNDVIDFYLFIFLIWHNFVRNANVAVDEAMLKWWLRICAELASCSYDT